MPFFKKTAHNSCSVSLCAVLVPILTFSLGANLVTLSSEPVLYPALSTLHRQKNGLVSLTIYSNQKKVVLYVEGVLFLFQSAASGDPEFIFEDIPVAKLPLHLAAEAGNLSISLTVTKL